MNPADVARQFRTTAPVTRVRPLPGGHINRSYVVRTSKPECYLLQQLNSRVFADGAAVMRNVDHLTRHFATAAHLAEPWLPLQHRIGLVPTTAGGSWFTADDDGTHWRLMPFIEDATVVQRADSPRMARTAARAFGAFLRLTDAYQGPPLHETIAHFHDTGWHLARLESAAREDPHRRVSGAMPELHACLARRALVGQLPDPSAGALPRRVVHNDAKIANVLLGGDGERSLAVVDLDTVMPGSALHDVGDLIRSLASPTDEDEPDTARVHARPELVVAVLEGWIRGGAGLLTDIERQHAILAGCVITLEQAVRFLADHLAGDRYYPATAPDQNLRRARTQLALCHSLERQRAALERQCHSLVMDSD